MHTLPVLREELDCARARLQSLETSVPSVPSFPSPPSTLANLETAAGAEAAAPAISLDELRAATANWNLDSKVLSYQYLAVPCSSRGGHS